MLGEQFLDNAKFQPYLTKNFLLFQATVQEPDGKAVFDRFKINATPTLMVFGPDGSEVDWIVGYDPPADKFKDQIDKIIQGVDTYKALSAAYAKDPKDVGTVFKLAQKWSDRYDTEKATEKYKEVLALDPDGKRGATTYNEAKVSYTEYAEFKLGSNALRTRQGKPDPAPLLAFIQKYPEGALVKDAYGSLATGYFGRSAPKADAARFFQEYTDRYPKEFMAAALWVRRIIQDKEPLDKGLEMALKSLDLARGPVKTSAYQSLAQVYLLKGDKAKAAETAEALLKSEEERLNSAEGGQATMAVSASGSSAGGPTAGTATHFAVAARIFIDAGQKDRALEVFGPEFLKKHIEDAAVLNGYTQFWVGQSANLESALVAGKKLVLLSPEAYRGWLVLGQVEQKLKSYDEALRAMEKALELAPAQPPQAKDNVRRFIEQVKAEMPEKK